MKKVFLALVLLASSLVVAQANFGSPFVFPGVPSGTCASNQLAVNSSNGNLYSCNGGTWAAVGGAFPLLATDGSVGAPSYSFASAPTWGLWNDANGLEWSLNGVNFYRWTSTGQFRISGSAGTAVGGFYIDAGLGSNIGGMFRNAGDGGLTINNATGSLSLQGGGSSTGVFLTSVGGQLNGATIGGIPNAAPATRNFQVGESSRTGTDSNVAGSQGNIRSGVGTGNATPSILNFNGSIAGASSSTAQTQISRFALNDTKQLTSGAATTVLSIPLATLQMTGGTIDYHIEINDGTSQCTRAGQMSYNAVNSAGVFVTSVTNAAGANDANACTAAKTLTLAWAATSANPTLIQVTPTSNIAAPTQFQIVYEVHHKGQTSPTL